MSILRSVIWNPRQRVTSTGLNQQQAMAAVNSQMGVRAVATSGIDQVALPIPFAGRDQRQQVAGLEPGPGVAPDTIELTPGALSTWSPAYPAPIPGEATTPWRAWSGLDDPSGPAVPTVPTPAIGPAWYLLEARVGEVVTSAVRDIRQLFTNLFAPQLVPVERTPTIEFQWTAGADGGPFPAFSPSGNGWVPICYVYRTNVGGPVAAADIYDVRFQPADALLYPAQRAQSRDGQFDLRTGAGNLVTLLTRSPAIAQGVALEWGSFSGVLVSELDLSTVLDPNDVAFAASTTYYLYLAPYRGIGIRRMDQPYQRGRLVLSTVQPTQLPSGGTSLIPNETWWTNSAPLAAPAPYALGVQVGEGTLVGAVIRNAANTGWVEMVQVGRSARIELTQDAGYFRQTNLGPSSAPWLCPVMAQEERLELHWGAANGAPISVEVQFTDFGGTGFVSGAGVIPNSLNNASPFDYCAAADGVVPTITGWFVSDAAGAPPATYSLTVLLRGWTW
jgi:hypothetical protein